MEKLSSKKGFAAIYNINKNRRKKKTQPVLEKKGIQWNKEDSKYILDNAKHPRFIDFCKIDVYNKLNNYIICCRDSGKTSKILCQKMLKRNYYEHNIFCYVERFNQDISESAVIDIETYINHYLDKNWQIKLRYESGGTGYGGYAHVWIKYPDEKEEKPFFIFVSLSFMRIKKISPHSFYDKSYSVKYIIFDEYIIDVTKTNHRYLKNEFNTIQELQGTLAKFSVDGKRPKTYFLGNTYSRTSPVTIGLNFDTSKMQKGNLFTGKNYACWCFDLPEETKKWLEKIRGYTDDDEDTEYFKFAVEANYIYDSNIKLWKGYIPNGYQLEFVLKYGLKYLNVFTLGENYCVFQTLKNIFKKREPYVLDINELIEGAIALNNEEKKAFLWLEEAIRKRKLIVDKTDTYHLLVEYLNLSK